MEFSYDSRNRAEVARETGNIVNFRATVFPNVGHDRRLFLETKQFAATQLVQSFLFEQTQRSLQHCGIRKNPRAGVESEKKSRPKAALVEK
ncbi:hypothetical protein [Paraburkholderia sp. RAU2J]|uniref:hypothetical protein n=1 Tax=Paraburkholderia sp. RAU2J TaxID=1938810 RepID=UPI0011C3E657|nr:hypothetical protein [Paraburkholderia sp. RAU2J]